MLNILRDIVFCTKEVLLQGYRYAEPAHFMTHVIVRNNFVGIHIILE